VDRSLLLRSLFSLTLCGVSLFGCLPVSTGATSSGTAAAPPAADLWATPQVTIVMAAPAPTGPPPRPTVAQLALPPECTAEESPTALVVTCPDGGLRAQWTQSPPTADRLDAWTQETMVQLKHDGVPLVLLGEPTCTVQDEPVACARVLGRSDKGIEDTRFLAVGASPEGGGVEVTCHWSKTADETTYQGLCQQVLRRI
jgi:hypothetical protein